MAYPGLLRSLRFPDILKFGRFLEKVFRHTRGRSAGFVFFMFCKVPRHTRGCSVAFVFFHFEGLEAAFGKGFSEYPLLLR